MFLIKDLMLLKKMPPFSFLKSTVRIFFIGGGECDFYLGHLLSHGWYLNKSAQNITVVNVNV